MTNGTVFSANVIFYYWLPFYNPWHFVFFLNSLHSFLKHTFRFAPIITHYWNILETIKGSLIRAFLLYHSRLVECPCVATGGKKNS